MKDEITNFWKKKSDKSKKEENLEEYVELSNIYSEKKQGYNKADYWKKEGLNFFEIGEWKKAIECFEKDLLNNKNSFESGVYKAISLYRLEKYAEALESFNKSWEIQCTLYKKFSNQSKTLTRFNEFEQAVEYDNKASQVSSIDPNFWFFQGICLHEVSKYVEAVKCFDTALKYKNNHPMILYYKSRTELKLGNHEKCIQLLKEASKHNSAVGMMLQVDPTFSELKNNRNFSSLLNNDII
jgi:tetratricopeptide (TPR) repeat protein